jgi:tellurite resistance protein
VAGIFHQAREALAQELARFRNRQFLEAAMAATALVAMADGEVSLPEQITLDQVLETVQELRIYDPHAAVDIYRDHVDALAADSYAAREKILEIVAKLTGDEAAGKVLVHACVAIAKSDEDFSPPEQIAVRELCRALGLDPVAFEL